MNHSRRSFLKNAAILSGAAGISNMLPFSIKKAMAINADKGTTFYDAEHIVFLMQENRSFDHIFGRLKGVRGYNDPRAKFIPGGNKVWIQKDKNGNAHAPFHIDINKTKITWQGGLAHSWPDQTGARNGGKYDQWIPNKSAMTMGYYDRSDVPFYYALADAFTICDHYFCSSLTGTTPNRLFFWSGNIRPEPNGNSTPAVGNEFAESRDNAYVDWSSFPDLLEDNDISWKVYQNEIWTAILPDKKDYWLGNYGDNALEYIKRNNVKLAPYFRIHGDVTSSPTLSAAQVTEQYQKLTQREKNIVDKMFSNNAEDENYLNLEPFSFINDKGEKETVDIPRGDIFHQFRKDVEEGNLPTVSWLVAPQAFSDHTSTPLYGTWYVSEALDILTKNPEVWKKTIFILNYDENDGYFDHLPPFAAPDPKDSATGKTSPDIDTASDYHAKDSSPIGLGYRVPCIIASPWSKGGFVNSQIFDHTSTLMFLEDFLEKKTGKKIKSPNISSWRRHICGDLTSAFRPYNGEKFPLPDFEKREVVIQNIQNAKNKPRQAVPSPLSNDAIKQINENHSFDESVSSLMPQQEKGVRPACALPYILSAECSFNKEKNTLDIRFETIKLNNESGAAFNMYTPASYNGEAGKTWAYAVSAGNVLHDSLDINKFENDEYNICIHGPNGFFRHFTGDKNDGDITIICDYQQKGLLNRSLSGHVNLKIENKEPKPIVLLLSDNAYGKMTQRISVDANSKKEILIDLSKNSHWYDFTLKRNDNNTFSKRYAGHVETGAVSTSDPFMGGLVV